MLIFMSGFQSNLTGYLIYGLLITILISCKVPDVFPPTLPISPTPLTLPPSPNISVKNEPPFYPNDTVHLVIDSPSEPNILFEWKQLMKVGDTLLADSSRNAKFVAFQPGEFVISAKSCLDTLKSQPSNFTIIIDKATDPVLGSLPVANAGVDASYLLFDVNNVSLDGSASSDPDGEPLTYSWQGAETNLEPFDVFSSPEASPVLNLSQPGQYAFILTVSNGSQHSLPDQVLITVENPDLFVSKTDPPDATHFNTITEALEVAQPGYLIFIKNGVYFENVTNFISNVTLLSTDSSATIIDGGNNASALMMNNVDGITVKGFTIRGGGSSDSGGITCTNSTSSINIISNLITGNADGIRLFDANNIIIENCKISGNDFNGIRTGGSSFEVLDCIIESNGMGDDQDFGGITVEPSMAGGNTGEISINIERNNFKDNEKNHIKILNNATVTINANRFEGIGGGVRSLGNSNAKLFIENNTFNGTTGAPVFCQDSEVDILSNLFDGKDIPGIVAIDLINCGGTIDNNDIRNYTEAGIRISNGGGEICPDITNTNVFTNNSQNWEYLNTTCVPPN